MLITLLILVVVVAGWWGWVLISPAQRNMRGFIYCAKTAPHAAERKISQKTMCIKSPLRTRHLGPR